MQKNPPFIRIDIARGLERAWDNSLMWLFAPAGAGRASALSLGLLVSILLGVSRVYAADIIVAERAIISEQDQTPFGCNIHLRGEIAPGDAERLRTAHKAVEPARQYSPVFLCLNSSGGSFVEALRILQWLVDADTGIATVIGADDQCLSACAIVFMGGSEHGHLNRYPRRWLHAKAKLGFHTPYIDADALPQRTYIAQELMNGFAAAMASSRELATQFARLRTQVDEAPSQNHGSKRVYSLRCC